ncbi:MAG: hypothetical protein AAF942_15270, partial [Pseudomonadota bacterium]
MSVRIQIQSTSDSSPSIRQFKSGDTITVSPGEHLTILGARTIKSATIVGGDYRIVLDNGDVLILKDFYALLADDDPKNDPRLTADGTDVASKQSADDAAANADLGPAQGAESDGDGSERAGGARAREDFDQGDLDPPPFDRHPLNQDFPFDELPPPEALPGARPEEIATGPANSPPDANDDNGVEPVSDTNFVTAAADGATVANITGHVIDGQDHGTGPDGTAFADIADTDPEGDPLEVVNHGSLIGQYGTL